MREMQEKRRTNLPRIVGVQNPHAEGTNPAPTTMPNTIKENPPVLKRPLKKADPNEAKAQAEALRHKEEALRKEFKPFIEGLVSRDHGVNAVAVESIADLCASRGAPAVREILKELGEINVSGKELKKVGNNEADRYFSIASNLIWALTQTAHKNLEVRSDILKSLKEYSKGDNDESVRIFAIRGVASLEHEKPSIERAKTSLRKTQSLAPFFAVMELDLLGITASTAHNPKATAEIAGLLIEASHMSQGSMAGVVRATAAWALRRYKNQKDVSERLGNMKEDPELFVQQMARESLSWEKKQ